MDIKPIKSERDYQNALAYLEDIFDAKSGTPEGDQLEVLSILIERYEESLDQIELPDPIEAIKFRMEQLGMNQKDLSEVIGYKSRVSEILNRKRKLSLGMIRRLASRLAIPADVLIQEY
ncbi:MAG: helix-turn-helix domain-containing protein [Saprospiraceae bacterium]|nr:helix-turn-helix domain-containing protein [Saprospiraceae bacterium]